MKHTLKHIDTRTHTHQNTYKHMSIEIRQIQTIHIIENVVNNIEKVQHLRNAAENVSLAAVVPDKGII